MTELSAVTIGLVGFATIAIVLSYAKMIWRRRKFPPGPLPMPVIGNALQLMSEGLMPSLVKMSEKYGQVYTVHFGPRPTLIVVGYQAVKEVLVDLGDIFLGRGTIPVFQRFYNNSGLTLLNGEHWKQMRQFSLLTLKDFGMGKKSLEEPIQEETQHLVEYFRKSKGKCCFKLHTENLDSETCFDKTNLVATVFDMFLGGAETTSVTLNFGILHFIKYPEIQDPTHRLFETPGKFNINHFLDENGKFRKNNGFMPFAAGKRVCIGESLVRMEIFIIFATILQKFTLKSVVDPKDLDISPTESGLESIPPSHKVIFIPRE
ncbi:hypothetical protein GDO81_007456 [Engystomops pustulosus]|uniref:Uncharacterized protein n=1 Tax=Engystomops pustulosus TaxID=76066 RepID=A0AAV7C7K7_ENGPU|nr:hypothetical protein GDO81_007456 [Engystomops pustulosus]